MSVDVSPCCEAPESAAESQVDHCLMSDSFLTSEVNVLSNARMKGD